MRSRAIGQRPARFEDVVDEEDVAPGDVGLDVAEHRDLAGGDRAGAVARQRDELDLGRHPGLVEGADQVGGEDEAALEDRDDEQVLVSRGGDLLRRSRRSAPRSSAHRRGRGCSARGRAASARRLRGGRCPAARRRPGRGGRRRRAPASAPPRRPRCRSAAGRNRADAGSGRSRAARRSRARRDSPSMISGPRRVIGGGAGDDRPCVRVRAHEPHGRAARAAHQARRLPGLTGRMKGQRPALRASHRKSHPQASRFAEDCDPERVNVLETIIAEASRAASSADRPLAALFRWPDR